MRHADFCRLRADSVQTVRRQRADSVQIRVDLQIYTNLHRGFQIYINLHEIYTKSTRICISLSLTKQAGTSSQPLRTEGAVGVCGSMRHCGVIYYIVKGGLRPSAALQMQRPVQCKDEFAKECASGLNSECECATCLCNSQFSHLCK